MKKTPNLVLIRHGESLWNKSGVFTGWVDVGLTATGEDEARRAGRLLKRQGFQPTRAYTSVLKRAVKSLWLVLEEMDLMWLPTDMTWRLNERHYGGLQGESKAAAARRFGKDRVFEWRRSYRTVPPPLPAAKRSEQISAKACKLPPGRMPRAESLRDTYVRVMPYWKKEILPALRRGEHVLVVAHGNSLRALMKHLEGVSDSDIAYRELPTGKPVAYTIR